MDQLRGRQPVTAWRGRSRPVHAAATGLVVLAGVISGWNIGWRYPTYYGSAARSMGQSWRAFFFGAFDPTATITLDKLSGFVVPQALAVRIFGFHPWAICLPQVIEGMITVAVLYVIGCRWRGVAAGLMAAGAAVTTPLLIALFGRASEDSLLTMSLTLALLCWQTAVRTGRWPALIATAAWVGVGFQAKMLQAWLILPALFVGFLVAGPEPVARRWLRGAAATVLAAGFSLSWITAIQLVPAADRPYIDGSTDNNGYAMVFGYNGVNRIIPNLIPGAVGDTGKAAASAVTESAWRSEPVGAPRFPVAVTLSTAAVPASAAAPETTASQRANSSPAKLLLPFFLPEIGWWYPAAAVGLITGLASFFRSRRRPASAGPDPPGPGAEPDAPALADRADDGLSVVLALWLLPVAVLLSAIRLPHFDYLAAVVVPVSLLAADGVTAAATKWRLATRRGRTTALSLIGIQLSWAVLVGATHGMTPAWVWISVAALGTAGLVLMVPARARPRLRQGLAMTAAACLLGPVVFLFLLLTRSDLVHGDPYAGPLPGQRLPNGSGAQGVPTDHSFGVEVPFRGIRTPVLSRAEAGVDAYVRSHPGLDGPLLATDIWSSAQPYLLDTGLPVLPFGGFSGTVATPSAAALQAMIADGQVRFALIDRLDPRSTAERATIRGGGFGNELGAPAIRLRSTVIDHCQIVPPTSYEPAGRTLPGQDLYSCDPTG